MRMKCIIIEGPQGCGKTSLANYLREHIPASNLYRLSGNKDKTLLGKEKSKKMYIALLDYMNAISNSDVNLIFDRTFFTEYVYCNLGYKDFKYDDVYHELLKVLGSLNYDIYYVSLYLKDPNIYETRLRREHHNYQAFSLQSSVDQQNEYKKLIPRIKALANTHVYEIATDDFDVAYKEIDEIFDIAKKKENN